MNMEIKPGYFAHTIDATFTTKKMLYLFWIPVTSGRYEALKKECVQQGKVIDWSIGMIEKPKMFGFGWIGLADTEGDTQVKGDFVAYKMVGEYTQFKSVWKKIMRDYPKITEGYHVYMTDPNTTKKEDNVTYILVK